MNLFRLGLLNAALLMIVAMLAAFATPEPPGTSAPQSLEDLPLQALFVQLLLYSPVLVLMWFAPLLAGWHGMTPGKAMFGSAIACWRNIGSLTLFGLGAIGLTTGASFLVVGVLAAIIPSRDVLSFIIAPVALVLMTIVQASFYPMYLSVFAPQNTAVH